MSEVLVFVNLVKTVNTSMKHEEALVRMFIETGMST